MNWWRYLSCAGSRNDFLSDAFPEISSEIIKFFSSIERVQNYAEEGASSRRTGDDRPHLADSTSDSFVYHSPKITLNEFRAIVGDSGIYYRYMKEVLLVPEKDIIPPYRLMLSKKKFNDVYIKVVNNVEKDWNFHRAFHKIFHDVDNDAMLFLDLQAYCATRHIRFFMREAFQYIEGNYVTTLRQEKKVYIPHLQFSKASVEMPYSSALGFELKNVIADYILKSRIKSFDELCGPIFGSKVKPRLEQIDEYRADVAKSEQEKIFLKTSQYIDHSKYYDWIRKWFIAHKDQTIDFNSRDSIIRNIHFEFLEKRNFNLPIQDLHKEDKASPREQTGMKNDILTPDDDHLFRPETKLPEPIMKNIDSDCRVFFHHRINDATRWQRRIIRQVFRDLIQFEINHFRMDEQGEQRTEYESVFTHYRDMSALEKEIGCLIIEDGEISFVLMLDRFVKQGNSQFQDLELFIQWGLAERRNDHYTITSRTVRMIRWCMKLMGLKYVPGKNTGIPEGSYSQISRSNWQKKSGSITIDYNAMSAISENYKDLVAPGSTFSWLDSHPNRDQIGAMLGMLASAAGKEFSQKALLDYFNEICRSFYTKQTNLQKTIRNSLANSRFQKKLNEWLRSFETIDRAVIAFPVNTIPSTMENKTRAFSIFIGTFNLGGLLSTDNERIFLRERSQLATSLKYAKIFYTLIGGAASHALEEAIIQLHTQRNIDSAIARFSHKIKNEGASLQEMANRLKRLASHEPPSRLTTLVNEVSHRIDRLAGAIFILNIAANGMKNTYMEADRYCLLDIVIESYYNALTSFFSFGKKEQRKKFEVVKDKSGKYELPVLRIIFIGSNGKADFKKDIVMMPDLDDVEFVLKPGQAVDSAKSNAGATMWQQICTDKAFFWVDAYPKKIIMLSPFFEIFQNALTYLEKHTGQAIIELKIRRNRSMTEIEIKNHISDEMINRPIQENSRRNTGLRATQLFFDAIGGSFSFKYRDKAIAKVIISAANLQKAIEMGEKDDRIGVS